MNPTAQTTTIIAKIIPIVVKSKLLLWDVTFVVLLDVVLFTAVPFVSLTSIESSFTWVLVLEELDESELPELDELLELPELLDSEELDELLELEGTLWTDCELDSPPVLVTSSGWGPSWPGWAETKDIHKHNPSIKTNDNNIFFLILKPPKNKKEVKWINLKKLQ